MPILISPNKPEPLFSMPDMLAAINIFNVVSAVFLIGRQLYAIAVSRHETRPDPAFIDRPVTAARTRPGRFDEWINVDISLFSSSNNLPSILLKLFLLLHQNLLLRLITSHIPISMQPLPSRHLINLLDMKISKILRHLSFILTFLLLAGQVFVVLDDSAG